MLREGCGAMACGNWEAPSAGAPPIIRVDWPALHCAWFINSTARELKGACVLRAVDTELGLRINAFAFDGRGHWHQLAIADGPVG